MLFALYIVLGHRVAQRGAGGGIDGLGASMLIALVVVTPLAGWAAAPAIGDPVALLAGVGVGISSSVIPYVCDQLAMAQLTRATYALMVSLLPATATVIGIVVLGAGAVMGRGHGSGAGRRGRRPASGARHTSGADFPSSVSIPATRSRHGVRRRTPGVRVVRAVGPDLVAGRGRAARAPRGTAPTRAACPPTHSAWHSATATSCVASQYEHDTYGLCSRWARLSGVGRVVIQPVSPSSVSSQKGCRMRERGRS